MKYCIQCNIQYEDDISTCEACAKELSPYEEIVEDFEFICKIENQFEAQAITQILNEENIPHIIENHGDHAFDGLFISQEGWGEVRVIRHLKDKATELLEAFHKSVKERGLEKTEQETAE